MVSTNAWLNGVTPFPYPMTPMNNITPATMRDTTTMLRFVEALRYWMENNVVPEFQEIMEKAYTEFVEGIKNAENTVIANKVEWQNLFDQFMSDIVVQLETLNDSAVSNLVTNGESELRISLENIFPTKELVEEKYVDRFHSDTGRIALGVNALGSLPDSYNVGVTGVVVALGYEALGSATEVKQSIAIGNKALRDAIKSRDNIAIGDQSLQYLQGDSANYDQANKGGSRNIAIGGLAGHFVNKGWGHTLIGRGAGQCVDNGTGLVIIGSNAASGSAPIGFSGEVENGSPWGLSLNEVVKTVLIGNSTGTSASARNIVAVGGYALSENKKSEANVGIGANALRNLDIDTGPNGGTKTTANISGTYSQTGNTITLSLSTPHDLSVGDFSSLRLTSGDSQTFQGDAVRAQVVSVNSATTFAVFHPISRTTNGNAIYLGKETIAQVAKNQHNIGLGFDAGTLLKKGGNNVFIGSSTGSKLVEANNVTAVGFNALLYKTDGSNFTEPWENVTGVGYRAGVSGPNQVQIGNSETTTYVHGTVQSRSDSRDKADVRETELGLDFINSLRPVDFKWDMRDDYVEENSDGELTPISRDGSKKRSRYHHGVIAQELPTDFGGLQHHSVNGGDDVYSVGYDEFIAPLIKAIQELTEKVRVLEENS